MVSTPHSSAFTQPKVLMSRSPAKTRPFGAVQCKLYVKGSKVRLLTEKHPLRHTCLPPACEAAFLETANGLGGIADIPKAQVTLETLHKVVFVFMS